MSETQGIGLKIFIIFHLKSKIQIFPIYEGLKFELIRITFEDTHIYFIYISVTIKFDEIKRDSINHFKDINNIGIFIDFNKEFKKSKCFSLIYIIIITFYFLIFFLIIYYNFLLYSQFAIVKLQYSEALILIFL